MPDFVNKPVQQCMEVELTGYIRGYTQAWTGNGWACSCLAFKYCRPPDKWCKHLTRWEKERCTWHSEFGIPQEEDGVCPECGSYTVGRLFAV
jgi:hypothetical protein